MVASFFKNGGPIGWFAERQERTSLSSCEAEIRATNATSKKVMDFCNLSHSVSKSGHTIDGLSSLTVLYNNNNACVKWSHNMTSKLARHIEIRENSIPEWVQDKTLNVIHVAGKINPVNIFTKEMKDGAHFRHLRDSFMICLSDFVNDSLLISITLVNIPPKLLWLPPLSVLLVDVSLTWPLLRPLLSVIPCQTLPTFAVLVDISFGSIIAWFLLDFFSWASPHCGRPLFHFFSQFELTHGVHRPF
jgi:hypothetical protein